MKRLTERDEYGNADIIGVNSANLQENLEFEEFNKVTNALNKLAKYEDLEKEKIMNTGLFDKNGTPINVGDKTRLILNDGEVREFDVCFKTVNRTVKTLSGFEPETIEVQITGIFFCWKGNDLLPCIDENGVSDVAKMEVIKHMSGQEAVSRLFD